MSDETNLETVWHKKDQAFDKRNTIQTARHGGESILLWGCFAAAGTGKLDLVTGIMDSWKIVGLLHCMQQEEGAVLSVQEKISLRNKF